MPPSPRDLRENAHERPANVPLDDPTYRRKLAPGRPVPRPIARHNGKPIKRAGESHVVGPGAPTPAELGFRMPAEFEPQQRIWVTTPTNPDTWPGCLDQAQEQHALWCGAMQKVVDVKTTQSIGVAPEDAWVRDYGPIFLIDDEGNLAINNFRFNSWGGKYPPWDKMDATPLLVADFVSHERGEHVPVWTHDMILEGGSFGVNGKGSLLTTEACLLHPNRNPSLDKATIEAHLEATLGVSHVIWMPLGLAGDDTDGHQDDLAQWVNVDTVVAVHPTHSGQPGGDTLRDHHDFAALDANWEALSQARDQDGQQLNLVALPVVDPPLFYPLPPDREAFEHTAGYQHGKAIGGGLVPASYANFLIANGHLFLPAFGRPTDDLAIRALEQAAPHLTVVPIRAEWLVVGLGALHCLSQQQPVPVDIYDPGFNADASG